MQTEELKIEDAIKIIKQACGEFVGNLADHQTIQAAIQRVEKALEPKPKEAPKK
jgi:hypothetical protein